MSQKLRLVGCVVVLVLLQTCVLHRVSYRSIGLDLLSVFVAFMALEAAFEPAVVGAFAVGLLRDFTSAGRPGTSALLYVAGALLLLFIRGRLVRENLWTDPVLVFLFVLCCNGLRVIGMAPFAAGPQLVPLGSRVVGVAFLSALVSPFFFALFRSAGVVDATAAREMG